MNQYTLSFKDEKLQVMFNKQNPIARRVLIIMSLLGVITCGGDFILQFNTLDPTRFLLSIGFTGYFFLQLCFIGITPKFVPSGIFLSNLIVAAIELHLNQNYNPYNGYLYGNNQMLIHSLLIYISSYRMSIVLVLYLPLLRTDYMNFFQISYTASATIIFLYINYQFEKQKRTLFLANLRDKAKDIIFPKIIEKPYYIFERDPESTLLITKCSSSVDQVLRFLEEAKIKGQTLQQKIYQIIKDSEDKDIKFIEEKIKIRYKNESHFVSFQIFNLESTFYSLQLNSFHPSLTQLKQQHKQRINLIKQTFRNILYSLSALSTKSLVSKNNKLAIQVRATELQLCLLTENLQQLTSIDLYAFLQNFVNYFSLLKMNLHLISQEKCLFRIDTIPHFLRLMFLEIIKQADKQTEIRFFIKKYQKNQIKINIIGITQIIQSKLLDICQSILQQPLIKIYSLFQNPILNLLYQKDIIIIWILIIQSFLVLLILVITKKYRFNNISIREIKYIQNLIQKIHFSEHFQYILLSQLSNRLFLHINKLQFVYNFILFLILQMNKYTLTFKDPKLQALYSKENPLAKKVLQIISIAGLLTCGVDFIQGYSTFEPSRFLLSIGFTTYFLLQLFLISLSEKVVPLGIFITNMIVAAIELYLNEKYNAYNGYLYGSNQMLIHSLLIHISSYRMTILKVLFTTMRTDHMTFFQISYTACAAITFLYINYEIEKQKRTLFLTNLREKAKDIIFPKIIDKPYFIFERDPETLQLQIKYSRQVVELEGFLDRAKINGIVSINYESIYQLPQNEIYLQSNFEKI